ncbi:MAG: hypothetical protein CMK07_11530 [Ponticaulis sp.]|nr:hypothetical protein [Ponticaulis sp.]
MQCKLVRFSELTAAELCRWEQLRLENGGYESPFYAVAFTRVVSELRKDVRVLVAGIGDKPELFWPLQINGRNAEPVGAPFCDYNGPIMSAAWCGDMEELVSQAGLSCVRMSSAYDPESRFEDYASERDGAYVADLSQGADVIFERQQKEFPKHAKKMRRLGRKVEREIGDLTFRFDDRNIAMFDQLIEWKRAQYVMTGRHDVLSPDWSRQMLWKLWDSEDPTCRGYLHTLRIGDELIAAEFNLTCSATIHGWIPAYDPKYSSYAPGFLIQNHILPEASERGYVHYDFGTSAGYYKKFFTNLQIPVVRATVRSKSPVSRLAAFGEKSWRGLEDAHIPKLSHLAGQVRRRYEVIRTCEPTFSGRLRGVGSAARQMLGSLSHSGQKLAEAGEE